MVEWYAAYSDYEDEARRLEVVVGAAAQTVATPSIDFSSPWRRVTLREAIREQSAIDIDEVRERDALAAAIAGAGLDIVVDGKTWAMLVDDLLSTCVEPTLEAPTFVFDYPVELSPFAKAHRSEPGYVERWEAFAGGMEIANAFSELNDPDEQRARFAAQREQAAAGDEEAQPFDEAFLEALEQGMPPTGGVGLGIDRLVMALTGARSIREVVLFPAMRDR
jgi:lysyl-tRNA synthetase class 2